MVIKTIMASHIAPIICHLCNLSLEHGVFSTQLKQARVLPLLTKPTVDLDDVLSPTFHTFPSSSNVLSLAAAALQNTHIQSAAGAAVNLSIISRRFLSKKRNAPVCSQ